MKHWIRRWVVPAMAVVALTAVSGQAHARQCQGSTKYLTYASSKALRMTTGALALSAFVGGLAAVIHANWPGGADITKSGEGVELGVAAGTSATF